MLVQRLVLLGLAAALMLAPLAAAGSQNDPETGDDPNDDVAINGGVNCGLPQPPPPAPGGQCVFFTDNDFEWANSDIDWAWVNDTTTDLLFTAQMKSGTAFYPGAEFFGRMPAEAEMFTYTFTFAFTINGTPFAAIATMGVDGVFELAGVASAFLVHDANRLTLTVPKDVVGAANNGVVVGQLVFTSHGEDDSGNTLDDRAPDAEGGRDYLVANSTAAAPATNSTAGNATTGSAGPAVGSTGSSTTRANLSGTSTRSSSSGSGSGSASGAASNTGDSKKDSPGLPLVTMLGAVALVLVIRRRL